MVTTTFAAALLLGFAAAQTQGNEDANGGGSGPSASGGHDGGGDEHLFSGSGRSSDDSAGSNGGWEPCSRTSAEVSAFLSSMDEDCGETLFIAGVYGDHPTTLETVCGCVRQASVEEMPDCEVDGFVFDADLHRECRRIILGQGSGSSIGDSDDTHSGDLEPWCGGSDAAQWFIDSMDEDCKTLFYGDNFASTPEQVCGCVVQVSAEEMPDCEDDGVDVVFDADLHHRCTLLLATAAPTISPTRAPSPAPVPSPAGRWTSAPTSFVEEFQSPFGLPVGSGPSTSKDEDATGGAFVVFIVLLVAASVFLSTAVAVRKYRKKDVGRADVASESASQPACDAANASTTDLSTERISISNPSYDTPMLHKADDAAEPVYSSADPACGKGNATAAEPVYDVGNARASVGYDIVDARGSVVYDVGAARGSVVYDIGAARGSVVYDIGAARGSVVYDLGSSENAIREEDCEVGVPVSRLNLKTDPVRPAIPEEDVEAGVTVSRLRHDTSFSSAITDWGDAEPAGQAYENDLTDHTDKWQDADGLPLRGRTIRLENDSLSDDDNDPAQAQEQGFVRRESMV